MNEEVENNFEPRTLNVELPREPREALMRWGVMCAWLREWGIGEWKVKRLVREGRIRRIRLDGKGRGFYSREEIKGIMRDELGVMK